MRAIKAGGRSREEEVDAGEGCAGFIGVPHKKQIRNGKKSLSLPYFGLSILSRKVQVNL